ncbi:uncharacterized protein LOC142340866 [Convolutriloba macropyga]|uniref:uncharacterized protein LOC142340866 n=1 Tax=Convolutriloba macropyga TaxID=536237 RepID=UPI003F51C445
MPNDSSRFNDAQNLKGIHGYPFLNPSPELDSNPSSLTEERKGVPSIVPALENLIVWKVGPVGDFTNCHLHCIETRAPFMFNDQCHVTGFRVHNDFCICHCKPDYGLEHGFGRASTSRVSSPLSRIHRRLN